VSTPVGASPTGDAPGIPGDVHPALRTPFCSAVGVELPVVQTGMGWVAGPRLVTATARAGALGVLASATLSLGQLVDAIAEVRDRTDRPFGVNLRTDVDDVERRIDAMAGAGVRVASFAQAPGRALVDRCHEAGLFVLPTVGARRHAEKVVEWGADAVLTQGAEGGGHTGAVPTSLLTPAVVDAVGSSVPVVAGGGFFDGRGLVAALAYGAHGIAMGTRFLLTQESRVPDAVKQRYLETAVTGTVVSAAVDGVPQRVVRTTVVDRLERAGTVRSLVRALANAHAFRRDTGATVASLVRQGRALRRSSELTWSQVVMAANAPMMTRAALVDGRVEAGILPTGQVVGELDTLPSVADVVHGIVADATAVLRRLEAGDVGHGG
jgi:NAD(P)H-dependent flavin oxidoreductase YrpB (nitropropane dioxygenase family)